MKPFSMILLWSLCTVMAHAQHMHNKTGEKAVLLPGLGNHQHKVSTSNRDAQKFFNQGLSLVYAFNHEEAALSFQRAAELDPQLAMAYWGIAEAVGPNYNMDVDPERAKQAYGAIQKALSLVNQQGARISASETSYIKAMSKRFSNDPNANLKTLALDYKSAMGDLHKRFPNDLDAATLYAESMMNLRPWQLWTNDGKPAEGTREILAVLESVLKRDPKHFGAIHYYIHALEASPNPERALPYARYLGKLTPGAGHLVHMPSHIYMRTGHYEQAAQSNVAAAAADKAYIETRNAKGIYSVMYYNHNLDFLQAALAMNGQYKEALKAAQGLEDNVAPHVKEMPKMETFMSSRLRIFIRFHRWDEILKIPKPDHSLVRTIAIWHFARGSAMASTGKSEQAELELGAFEAAANSIPANAAWGNNRVATVFEFLGIVLKARIARAKGDTKHAIQLFNEAIKIEDGFIYDEPTAWNEPTREFLGALLFQTGDYLQAEKTFRTDLEQHPQNGRSLFGLARSLKAQGKHRDALIAERKFEAAWKTADTKLRMEDW